MVSNNKLTVAYYTFRRSTAFAWGGTAGAVALYVTDWTVVMQYVPFINKKYDHEIPQ